MRRLSICFALLLASFASPADEGRVTRKAAASFADTRDALVAAIENRGLVINYTAHIADMLERTGHDLGKGRKIFEHAEIVEFCSAKLSRTMMEADPHNIVHCPFSLSVYSLPGEKDATWIAYRLPQGQAAAIVVPLLEAIAAEAAAQ